MLPIGIKIDNHKAKYNVTKAALQQIGSLPAPNDPEARIVWWDGFIPESQFRFFKPYQRVNKIPGMDIICYKSTTFQALNSMKATYPSFYTFFPITYQLPLQFTDFQNHHNRLVAKERNVTWIIKPKGGCCGDGIKLVQTSAEAANYNQPAIIQRYISPYLLDEYKFDFRFYILISNVEPLNVFIFNEGLARFCTNQYHPPDISNLSDRFSHLTNTSVNSSHRGTHPILRTAKVVLSEIAQKNPKGKAIWGKIKKLATFAMLAIYLLFQLL